MKLPFPRRFKAWLVALVSLTAVALVSIAPMMRPRAQSSTTYTFTDLGTLGTGTYSRALGINNCGQIVGESSLTGVSPTHPFIWRNGVMSDLGTLVGGTRGLATDINASGLVVGTSTIANGDERAFRWFDLDGDGTPDPGEMNDLGVLPNHSTHNAFGVNDNGQIVGSAEEGLEASGFIWNANTGLEILATHNGIQPSHGYAINNSSNIAGHAATLNHAFVFDGTTNIDLDTFGGPRSIAYDINAAGHAVGFADVDNSTSSPPSHAFKWNGTLPLQDLTVLTGGVRSQAYSINSSGIVVGYSEVTGGALHAFVHDGTQMYDLNALLDSSLPPGWTLTHARGINDGGQIVGHGTTSGGETHAFLLTPTTFIPSCSPTVTVAVSPASVSEDGAPNLTYTFTRAPVTSAALTVNFSTTGTADSSDYGISQSGSVTIPANQQSATVVVDPATDSLVETNETVVLTTSSDAAYTIAAAPLNAATGTITDDDPTPTISITSVTAAEPTSGPTNFVFTVSLTNPSSSQITVNYATDTTGATATGGASCGGGVDFVSISGPLTLTFLPGDTSRQLNVTVCGDTELEPDETFFVNLSGNSANSVLSSNPKGTGTITPQAPTIFTEAAGPSCPAGNCAIAIDSVTFVRAPFKLTNEWNFTPSDRATRVILFTSNLGMTQADLATPNLLSVHIAGYGTLPIEHVGAITGVTGLSASYIVVRLPADLGPNPSPGPNNLTLTVKMGSAESNATTLSIIP